MHKAGDDSLFFRKELGGDPGDYVGDRRHKPHDLAQRVQRAHHLDVRAALHRFEDDAGDGARLHGVVRHELHGKLAGETLGLYPLVKTGIDHEGVNRGDLDVVAGHLIVQEFGDGPERELDRGVRAPSRQAPESLAGGDVDDVAVLSPFHLRQEGVDVVERPEEIDIHELLPLLHGNIGQLA